MSEVCFITKLNLDRSSVEYSAHDSFAYSQDPFACKCSSLFSNHPYSFGYSSGTRPRSWYPNPTGFRCSPSASTSSRQQRRDPFLPWLLHSLWWRHSRSLPHKRQDFPWRQPERSPYYDIHKPWWFVPSWSVGTCVQKFRDHESGICAAEPTNEADWLADFGEHDW